MALYGLDILAMLHTGLYGPQHTHSTPTAHPKTPKAKKSIAGLMG